MVPKFRNATTAPDFHWFYRVVGALLTTFALVSLLQKLLGVGLAAVLAETLQYYRDLVHPIMLWLLGWVHWLAPNWSIEDWVKDLYALSFLGAAVNHRAIFKAVFDGGKAKRFWDYVVPPVCSFLIGASGMGLFPFTIPLLWLTMPREHESLFADTMRNTATGLLSASAGSAAFFAVNSQL